MISVERNGRKVEGAVMVQPGQADDTVVIPVGYGRTKVGQVGEGAGFNAYKIRTADAFGFGTGFNVTKTGRTYPLARTQEFDYQEEPKLVSFQNEVVRPLIREGTIEEFKKEPNFAKEMVEHPPLRSLYGDYDYSKGQQWAMAIDLNACIGCNACMIACVAENNIGVVGKEQVARGREMHWIRLDRYYTGSVEEPQAVTAPVTCMQCETAPCENVCPVAATVHSPEGLERYGVQPLCRYPVLFQQLPVQSSPLQLLELAPERSRSHQDGLQPGGDGADARRDGEVHVLRAAHSERQDSSAGRRIAAG